MRVTLIRPSMMPHIAKDAMEPLAMAMLAAYQPFDIEYKFYDNRLEEIPFDEATDLVAITIETYTALSSYKIASEYKKRGVPVVMGGYHATFLPYEALQYCDAVVCGDAEKTWPALLTDFKNGRMRSIYKSDNKQSLAGIVPNREIFKGKKYAPVHMVQYGRGCRYNCDFCSIKTFYKSYLGQRPIEDVVKEIESLKYRHLFITDDNVFSYRNETEAFFKALAPLKIKWSGQISIDIASDEELVKLMAKSGCISVVIGFESLNAETLAKMRKGWNLRHNGYDKAIRLMNEYGIMIYGTFVHGYDTDTQDTFKINLDFALEKKFFLANFNPLTPTPGTTLYSRLKKENRLLKDPWWLDEEYRYGYAHFTPAQMTPQQLTDGCYWARSEFTKSSNIVRRLALPKTNLRSPYHLGAFLLANVVSRSEIRKKHGILLSDPKKPLIKIREASAFGFGEFDEKDVVTI